MGSNRSRSGTSGNHISTTNISALHIVRTMSQSSPGSIAERLVSAYSPNPHSAVRRQNPAVT
mgnify:CR=1 FL=1